MPESFSFSIVSYFWFKNPNFRR